MAEKMKIAGDIPSAQLHSLLSLLASAILMEEDLEKRRHYLLEGLAKLLGAHSWTWTQQGLRREDERKVRSKGYACVFPGVAERGAQLIATRAMEKGASAKVVFERLPGQEDFGERETRLVSLTLEEVPWLFGDFFREETAGSAPLALTPREQSVLALMKDGHSRQDIASALSLSEHTVSGYIKTLFRKLGVHSHSQLMGLALREKPFPNDQD